MYSPGISYQMMVGNILVHIGNISKNKNYRVVAAQIDVRLLAKSFIKKYETI
jgi:hypothetical protein